MSEASLLSHITEWGPTAVLVMIFLWIICFDLYLLNRFKNADDAIDRAETRVTSGLLVMAIIALLIAHLIGDEHFDFFEFLATFSREVGFACLVALFIKFINESFLRKNLLKIFRKQTKEIGKSVLDHTFQQLIPPRVFQEIKSSIFNDLKFMKTEQQILFDFKELPDGRIKITQHMIYTLKKLIDASSIYYCKFGYVEQDINCEKKLISMGYKLGAGFETNKKEEIDLLDKCSIGDISNFGQMHKEYSCEIPFSEEQVNISIKQTTEAIFNRGVRNDASQMIFLGATDNVSIRILDCIEGMTFEPSAFGSKGFNKLPSNVSYKHFWRYKGCFLPYQGLVMSWTAPPIL